MRIQVTQEHIDRGREQINAVRSQPVCKICPVALALADTGFGDPQAFVGVCSVWTDGMSIRRTVPFPPGVSTWINAFDRGMPVEPFSFDIEDVTP